MNLIEIIDYCLNKPGTWSDLPFDEETLVIKVGSKMFCLIGSENSKRISLKCDPLKALDLRQRYKSVIPGYHLNKKHWNTILLDGSLDNRLLKEMIDHSYKMVYSNLTQKERNAIIE